MDRADWFEAIWSWAKAILLVAFFGAVIWLTLSLGSEEPPSYFELQAAVAASQTCDELTAAHDSALRTHEDEAIDDQQMNTVWRRVLDRAERSSYPEGATNGLTRRILHSWHINKSIKNR